MSAVLTNALVMGVDDALVSYRDAVRRVEEQPLSDNQQADLRRAAWMAAAQAGDRVAYERVLGESTGVIRSVARRQGVPVDLLDDVVQETLITIHRVRHTYDPSRSYHAWLAAIAARRGIDALRQHGRRDRRELHEPLAMENHADEHEASDATEHEQRAAALREAIATLPPGQREAVEHLGLRERSLAETAALTGRSTGALKVNLHRALKALRGRLHGDS